MLEPTALDPEADPVLEPNSSSDATTCNAFPAPLGRIARHLKSTSPRFVVERVEAVALISASTPWVHVSEPTSLGAPRPAIKDTIRGIRPHELRRARLKTDAIFTDPGHRSNQSPISYHTSRRACLG